MAVNVEVSRVPMHPLANPVGQPPHSKDVARPIKNKRIDLIESLAGENLIFYREQARVVSLKSVRVRHLPNNNPALRRITSPSDDIE